ncbi:MAG: AmmeMemoRadiSam system radical SAM enzyme [Chlorobiaceae bacterium]|nr:AmmeMemoRadiSam system radical SAM enzyme [Chlorobiaceae bacterium]NTW73771.1 AmmeMemoRadiSam system radical SAM enzyme [Chlorobiaceae bacterium]
MRRADFCHETPDGKIQCDLCCHFCRILPGRSGICKVRRNIAGSLFSLNFGAVVTASADPVEKKPLHHFMPGSTTWSFGAPGCNFTCANSQNWQNSQATPDGLSIPVTPPETVVADALRAGCRSISCTSTEPTIYAEYALEVLKLARDSGLGTIWVSNGYLSPLCLDTIMPWVDAINVDLKSMDDAFYRRNCGARLEPVLDNLRRISRSGMHLEVTTLLIPGQSDHPSMIERMTGFIADELGRGVPWHIIPFRPGISRKMQEIAASSRESIETAWEIGRKAGLFFIYSGEGHSDTVCPRCGRTAIQRHPRIFGTTVVSVDTEGGCPSCHASLSIKM